MALSRELTPMERRFMGADSWCQLAMVVESKSARDFLIDRLKSQVLGFQLRVENGRFVSAPGREIPVHDLPSHFPTLEHASTWMTHATMPRKDQVLASLAANDTTVILNVYHVCSDGGYFKMIVDHIFDGAVSVPGPLPIAPEEVFARQLRAVPAVARFVASDGSLTRIFPNRAPGWYNGGCAYITFTLDPESLPCYNKTARRVEGLTEHTWASEILASTAFNGRTTNTSCSTCMDLRSFYETPASWGNTVAFAAMNADAHAYGESGTFGGLRRRLREDFDGRMRRKEYLSYLKGVSGIGQIAPSPGLSIELSNLGLVRAKRPFVDVWMQETCSAEIRMGFICLQSTQVETASGKSPLIQRLRYARGDISEREALLWTRMVAFAMKSFDASTEVGQAIAELRKFKQAIEGL
jgi:hypothetical protein